LPEKSPKSKKSQTLSMTLKGLKNTSSPIRTGGADSEVFVTELFPGLGGDAGFARLFPRVFELLLGGLNRLLLGVNLSLVLLLVLVPLCRVAQSIAHICIHSSGA